LLKRIIITLLVVQSTFLFAQKEQPKIALVLSGGGARGMAHIGVLQVLEEVGIYPDYITGTSMGSVVGGLYALGYTSDELDSITKTADWNVILGNDIDYTNVAYEEKEFFGRYLLELPMDGLTPSLPKGLLEGQNLNKLFSDLTRSAHDINSFDSLPIPFRAVATDIATGKSVTLGSGSLTKSMRASMAIPSVFTPIEIDGKLLVDGGLVRNFPVTEAKDMGADIIIGVFVSTDLDEKEDLKSLVDILFQSSFVMSAYDSREQTQLVNYYVEPNLTGYSSSSFSESDSIVARGYKTASAFKEQFQNLYDSLTKAGKVFKKPERLPTPETYALKDIRVDGNSDLSDEFIIGRLPLKEGIKTTIQDIDAAVDRIYGTRYFSKVSYDLHEIEEGEFELVFTVEEKAKNMLKFAVHYNNETQAGINLNYTSRNNVLPNSRFVAEIDLAERFRADFSYLKYLGKRQLSAVSAKYHYNNTIIPIFQDGQQFSNFNFDRHDAYFRFQSTNRPDMTIGVDYHWNTSFLRPEVTETFDFITKVRTRTNSVRAFYEYISLNRPFIPIRGSDIRLESGLTLLNEADITYNENSTPEEEEIVNNAFASKNFFYFSLRAFNYLQLSNRTSLITSAEMVYTSEEETGFNHEVGIGGFYQNYSMTTTLWGAQFYQYSANNFMKLGAGLQIRAARNVYLKAMVNYINTNYPLLWFDSNRLPDSFGFREVNNEGQPSLEPIRQIYGYGISIAFNSILGPLEFNAGTTNLTDRVRLGLSIGYWY